MAACVAAAILTLSQATGSPGQPTADLVIRNANVATQDESKPAAQAIAIRDGRIIRVGSNLDCDELAGDSTRVLELGGALVIPGLTDAHAHLMNLGRFLANVNLVGSSSPEQARELVLERIAETPDGAWIQGRGWDQNDWASRAFPHWRDLAGTESHPVYLRRVDGHAAWVNKTALDACGITTDTPDPPGGRIERDADGEPTGVFVDNATDLITAHIPPESFDERMDFARRALAECVRNGLTGVHDAGLDSLAIEVFREMGRRGELTLRIYGMLSTDGLPFPIRQMARGPIDDADGLLRVRAIKLYADGALGSRGAALLAPYSDDSANSGLFVTAPESMSTLCSLAVAHGFQVCTHAIGDAGVRRTLDIYEFVLKGRPELDHRFRVEHAQVIAPADIPRFASLGVIPSMQPTHATSDMPWAEARLGPERVKGAYAWRQLLSAGCRIPLGSDFPVESVNPLWGIYAAVARQDHNGHPSGGWRAEECMTMQEAVRGFTQHAAYASFMDSALGVIREGGMADLTVLDRDIFKVVHSEILDTRPLFAIVSGRVVYQPD